MIARSPLVAVLLWLAVAAVAVPTAVRASGWDGAPVAVPLALFPYVVPVAVVVAVAAAVARRWPAAVLAVLLLAVQLAWLAPRAVADPVRAAGGPRLRVMAFNMYFGRADPVAVVDAVRARRPDVLVLSELTFRAVRSLDLAGLAGLLPHQALYPDHGAAGTGLYSRLPLRDTGEDVGGPTTYASPQAGIDLGGRVVTVRAVHTRPPTTDVAQWQADLDRLRTFVAGRSGPVVVMGDFNATEDHPGFRAILAAGVRDAGDAGGRGLAGTWPAGRRYPPLVTIDHVLVSDELAVVSDATLGLPGSDHMAITADLALRVPDDP